MLDVFSNGIYKPGKLARNSRHDLVHVQSLGAELSEARAKT